MPFKVHRPFFLVTAAAICVTALAADGRSQQYLNRFWQTDDGMPSNVVSAVVRDDEGFLWIGTGAGVTRFDGWRFETFDSDDGLPNTQISCLHIDVAGRLWAGTRTGVAWRDHEGWHSVEGMAANWIFAIGESADGSIWFGTYTGCWRWKEGTLESVNFGGDLPDTRSFLPDGQGGLWILTRNRVYRWHQDDPTAALPQPGPWDDHDLRGLARDFTGRMLVCGSGLLLRENHGTWDDLAASMPADTASSILSCTPTPDGALWIGTRDVGTLVLDDGEWLRINASNGQLSLDDVRSLIVDSEGLVWVGTNGGGLNQLRRQRFESYSTDEGLGRTVTSSLAIAADGTVWAGTDGSALLRLHGGRFVPQQKWQVTSEKNSIWSLATSRDGSLWIGTYRNGPFRMNEEGSFTALTTRPGQQPTVTAFFETRNRGMLVGVKDDLPEASRAIQLWSEGEMDPSFPQPPTTERLAVHDLLEARDGTVWVACNWYGLWKLEPDGWHRPEAMLDGHPLNPIALCEGADGSIWIGTAGQGLLRNDRGVFTRWLVSDGLLSNSVVQVLEDQAGDIWIGTDSGLQRLDRAGLEAVHGKRLTGLRIGREDGLPTPQFTGDHGNLCSMAGDGSMWFSLASGAIHLDPSQFSDPRPPSEPRIEFIETDREAIWKQNGSQSDKPVVIPAGSGTIRLGFTAPEFISPERLRFQCRMIGVEHEWQTVEGARSASYGSLPPGLHRFSVRVLGRDGAWGSSPASIELLVMPHLWQRLGFRVAVAALSAVALSMLVRALSLRRARRKIGAMRLERRIDAERARIAQDLHDDLGASLTEINFLGTLLGRSIEEKKSRDKVAAIVARARGMAKALDEIVWTINPENNKISSTVYYLVSRVRESLDTVGMRSRLTIPDDIPETPLDSSQRHHLLMTVNEVINNAMKHSGASEIHLIVELVDTWLRVSATDNGRGFDPAKVSSERNGLRNMHQRMKSAGGTCEVSSSTSGTKVVLEMPLPTARKKRK